MGGQGKFYLKTSIFLKNSEELSSCIKRLRVQMIKCKKFEPIMQSFHLVTDQWPALSSSAHEVMYITILPDTILCG